MMDIGALLKAFIYLISSSLLYPVLFLLAYVVAQAQYVRSLHGVAQNVRASFGDMNASLAETLALALPAAFEQADRLPGIDRLFRRPRSLGITQ